MRPAEYVDLFFTLATGLVLFRYWRQILDAIGRFRGGPPSPMHPSPAGDDEYLRRRSREA